MFFAAEVEHFLDQLFDGDVSVLGGGETFAVPQRQQVVVDAADMAAGIPQADRDARAEHRGDQVRRAVHEQVAREEVVFFLREVFHDRIRNNFV